MPVPFVAYAPKRIRRTVDVYGFDLQYTKDLVSAAVLQTLGDLASVGWTIEDTEYATGDITFGFGYPYFTDPEQPGIVNGNVVNIQGNTIHLVTPYQLLHNPPVYEGAHLKLAGTSSEQTGGIVAAAISEISSFDGTREGNVIHCKAKLPGALFNNIALNGNGALSQGSGARGGGSTASSQPANGTSRLVVVIIEDSLAHLNLTIRMNGLQANWVMAWRRAYTLVANAYQFALFVHSHAEDVIQSGDGNQYNNFVFACAPYLEPALREAVTYCAFVIRKRDALFHGAGDASIWLNERFREMDFTGVDAGVTFPMLRMVSSASDGGPLFTTGGKPLISKAWVALSKDLSRNDSETRIVGTPWDAIVVSDYYDWGTDIEADDHQWTQLFSQGKPPGNNNTAGTLFLCCGP